MHFSWAGCPSGPLCHWSLSCLRRRNAKSERETRTNTRAYSYSLGIHPLWFYTFFSGIGHQFLLPGILCAHPLQKQQFGAWHGKAAAPHSHARQRRALVSYILIRQHTNLLSPLSIKLSETKVRTLWSLPKLLRIYSTYFY